MTFMSGRLADGPEPNPYLVVIITAADERQAVGYLAQIEIRRQSGFLPESVTFHVVASPGGRQIGSGGMTLLSLHRLTGILAGAESIAEAFAGRRVIIINAGGESRRLPAYAAEGKLFTPLPCRTSEGHPAALFDLLLDQLRRIPPVPGGHVLVAAGDVLPTFDSSRLRFDKPGVTGVAYPDGPERASRHGVYVIEADGRVADFLQKPDRSVLRAHGLFDELGTVLIDTGLLSFCPASVERLCRAAGLEVQGGRVVCGSGLLADLLSGDSAALNLYEEVVSALLERITRGVYEQRMRAVPRNARVDQQSRLRRLYQDLHGLPFQAVVLPDCDFFHIGTSRELLAGLTGRTRAGATYGFRNMSRAATPGGWPSERAFVFNSVVELAPVVRGSVVLLEASHARGPLELGGRNLVTGLPGGLSRPVRLASGICLLFLPAGSGDDWATVVYGVDDGSQGESDDLGELFLNAPFGSFLRRHGIDPEWIWSPEGERTVHSAMLWCVGHPDDVLKQTDWMLAEEPDEAAVEAWRDRERWSIAELVRVASPERMLAHRTELQRLASVRSPLVRLLDEGNLDAEGLAGSVKTRREAADAVADLARGIARQTDPMVRARAFVLAMHFRRVAESRADDDSAQTDLDTACRVLTGDAPGPEALGRVIDAAVADAVAGCAERPSSPRAVARVARGRTVWATAPARLDLAGGWTDTPPICLERGGAVVNAAVTLGGRHPIQVFARWNDEWTVSLASLDSGRHTRLDRVEQVLDFSDPTDWAALPKACLSLAGLTAGRTGGDLRDVLKPFGGGIDLTLFSSLPRGSGLGTSSILAAAALACLSRLLGEDLTRHDLVHRTLMLEQRLTTGGGWQDQIGGLFGGVKHIRFRPGLDQSPSIVWLALDGAFVRERLLLYDTGIQRLAKGILRNVVHAYLAGDKRVHHALDRLESATLRLRAALESRDLEAFGTEFREYWELKKRLDPGTTTPQIEAMIDSIRPHCTGWGLLGAGGGGFLLLIARDGQSAGLVRSALADGPPGARFVDFSIDEEGLCIMES